MSSAVVRDGTYHEVHREVCRLLVDEPDGATSPRGERTVELVAPTLILDDPRARLVASPARAPSYGFAAGEFLWYLRGARDLESIEYYNRRMRAYSDDGVTLPSAYGARLGMRAAQAVRGGFPRDYARDEWAHYDRATAGGSQWLRAVDELVTDPDSRRAVLTIFAPGDLARARSAGGTRDVPCTLSFQFLVRQPSRNRAPRLILIATMRSNDAWWGLTNDLFSFTLLQETMALDLREAARSAPGAGGALVDLELGEYVHRPGSLHLYDRHAAAARAVLAEPRGAAPSMPAIASRADLDALLDDEATIRGNPDGRRPDVLGGYGGGAGWLRDRLVDVRARRLAGENAPAHPENGPSHPPAA